MRKTRTTFTFILFIVLASFSFSFAGERDVLKALEKIKGFVEVEKYPTSKELYNTFCGLLADANVEINLLGREKIVNECFLNAVKKSQRSYESGKNKLSSYIHIEKMAKESSEKSDSIQKKLDEKYMSASGSEIISVQEMMQQRLELVLKCKEKMLSILQELPSDWNNGAIYLDEAYRCLK